MTYPTRAQVFEALATDDALPKSALAIDYGANDRDRYDRALDVLAAAGWLPDPNDSEKVSIIGGGFEEIIVEVAPEEGEKRGGITLGSPKGHRPFTTAARKAEPIERLAAARVTVRVGDAEVEISGPNAEAIAGAVFSAFPAASGSPLPSADGSSDAEIIPFPVHGRGRQVAPQNEGA